MSYSKVENDLELQETGAVHTEAAPTFYSTYTEHRAGQKLIAVSGYSGPQIPNDSAEQTGTFVILP